MIARRLMKAAEKRALPHGSELDRPHCMLGKIHGNGRDNGYCMGEATVLIGQVWICSEHNRRLLAIARDAGSAKRVRRPVASVYLRNAP